MTTAPAPFLNKCMAGLTARAARAGNVLRSPADDRCTQSCSRPLTRRISAIVSVVAFAAQVMP
jgi:hypothetical protein